MIKWTRMIVLAVTVAGMAAPARAQINNSLFFMHQVPQANRINPAYQPECGFYLGLPVASPARIDFSSNALAYGDVIFPHPTEDSLITFLHPLSDKAAFLDKLKPVNTLNSSVGTSLASVGVRTPVGFFSLDVITRFDAEVSYPRDLFRMLMYGTEEGETYNLDGLGTNQSLYNEISLGWSWAMMSNLTIGARGKLLFGVADQSTIKSELSLLTSQDLWDLRSDVQFNVSLPFAEVVYGEDGLIEDILIDEELEQIRPLTIPGYMFNTRNPGFGVDLGADYRPIDPLRVSVSILDLGFINWKDEVHKVSYSTEYLFDGLELNPFELGEDYTFGDYLDSTLTQLGDSLMGFLTMTPGGTYTRRLNTKLFVGVSYDVTPDINFGLMSRTDFLDGKVSQQLTASANLSTGRFANLTLSYSYINNYFNNLGAGLSFHVGPLNLYLISDNLLNVIFWPQETRNTKLWVGMNLVFGYKQFGKDVVRDHPLIY